VLAQHRVGRGANHNAGWFGIIFVDPGLRFGSFLEVFFPWPDEGDFLFLEFVPLGHPHWHRSGPDIVNFPGGVFQQTDASIFESGSVA
jgi:hypothetical protein